jgi:hypothetical protein
MTAVHLTAPAPEQGFLHYPDPAGSGRVLIAPSKAKHVWTAEERPFRSVILNPDGTVASSGLPKFHNAGEYGADDHTDALWDAVRNGQEIRWTDKADGSLIIRSVIDGEVILRTRGSWDGGAHGRAARAVAAARYPALLDPALHTDVSLLFEFVSPNPEFRIILSYERDDLLLLGAVEHDDLRMWDWPALEDLSAQIGVPLVTCHTLPSSRKQLLAEIAGWEGREGVVARLAGGQILVKLKSKRYLTMHRIRFLLSARAVRELCETNQIASVEDFNRQIAGEADWEMLKDVEPMVQAYLGALIAADARMTELDAEMLALSMRHPGDRKSIAQVVTSELDPGERAAAFLLLDGREHDARERLRKVTIDQVFEQFAAVEADVAVEA